MTGGSEGELTMFSFIFDFLFNFTLSWFTLSHTSYILTLVDNVHLFPGYLAKVNSPIPMPSSIVIKWASVD